MKKISVFFVFIIMMFCTIPTFAANSISELPNVKIVIDGQIGTYKSTPISIKNEILLPLKEILVNLGVQDDKEHIIWNANERSVTIIKDTKTIFLKVDSNKALVNGEEIVLDTIPVIYKDNTYIPVKFIAQSLGMKVVWDGSSRSVIIRNLDEFNKIKDIIEKSNKAMSEVNNCKVKVDISSATKQENMSFYVGMQIDSNIDLVNKKMYMNMKMDMAVLNMNIDMYFADNTTYMKNPLTNEWEKETLSQSEYDEIFADNTTTDILDATDAICAGLKEVESQKANEILLKGDVFLGDLLSMADQSSDISDVEFDKFNVEISLDKNTYTINSLVMETNSHSKENSLENANIKIKCDYSDYNSKVEIVVPEEVIKNAVENFDLENEL